MFSAVCTPVSMPEARQLFPQIDTSDFHDSDYLFHTTMRILYADHATEECPIKLRLFWGDWPGFERNTIQIVFDGQEIGKNAKELCKTASEVEATAIFMRYKMELKAFVKEDLRCGVVFVNGLATNKEHYILSLFARLSPWFFKENSLTTIERELLTCLLKDNASDFNALAEKWSLERNIESQIQNIQFKEFISKLLERKQQRYTEKEKSLISEIQNTEDTLRVLYREYNEISAMLLGIKDKHDDDAVNDFANVFRSNPNCKLIKARGTQIEFVLTGFITNFNESTYRSVSRETQSVLYQGSRTAGIDVNVFKKMLDELMLGNRYRLNCAGKFVLDFGSNTIALQHTYSNRIANHAMPNPHIAHFTCMGGFAALYNSAFKSGDYMEVLDIAFSEVQNVNWADYSPVSKLGQDLAGNYWNVECVWDKKENKFIKPSELMNILKGAENG